MILIITSCNEIPLPDVENCTVLSNGATCTDKRLPKDKRTYDLSFEEMKAYQCTNPIDYQLLLEDIDNKRKELIKLRRNCSNGIMDE